MRTLTMPIRWDFSPLPGGDGAHGDEIKETSQTQSSSSQIHQGHPDRGIWDARWISGWLS